MLPDFVKVIIKNISEFKLLMPEKQVTRINRAIRQYGELSRTSRAPYKFKERIMFFIRNKTGTVNSVDAIVNAFYFIQLSVIIVK